MAKSMVIVGLGNPGKAYTKTRHNVGFWCVERVMERLAVTTAKEKFHGLLTETVVAGIHIYLLRPQTYMNLSGQSVSAALRYLSLSPEQIIVTYDDLDIPVGTLRLREKGSAGGHNGIKSMIAELGTDVFARIRIGIGRPQFDVSVSDYVLAPFAKVELAAVDAAVDRAAEAVLAACQEPFVQVMNRFN